MGASQHKEVQVQSQPVLPACHSKQIEIKDKQPRLPLSKKEIVANFMESFKKIDSDKKEQKKASGAPKGEIKLKKARQLTTLEKENEFEDQDIESMGLRSREMPQEKIVCKKGENAQLFIQFKTTPLVGGQVLENEMRSKKCRISKML